MQNRYLHVTNHSAGETSQADHFFLPQIMDTYEYLIETIGNTDIFFYIVEWLKDATQHAGYTVLCCALFLIYSWYGVGKKKTGYKEYVCGVSRTGKQVYDKNLVLLFLHTVKKHTKSMDHS